MEKEALGNKNLIPNKSSWKNSETTAVRVPKIFKDQVIAYARQLDIEESQTLLYSRDQELIAYSRKLLLDRDKIRVKDRWMIKNLLSELFGIDKNYYSEKKPKKSG